MLKPRKAEPPEETRNGLVRRRIKTAKGAWVYRWVRLPGAPPGLQAARAARRAKIVVPKPVEAPKPKQRFALSSFAGCCGARLATPEPPQVGTLPTEEEMLEAYKKTQMYGQFQAYEKHIKNAEQSLELIKAGKKPTTPHYRGYEAYGKAAATRYIEQDLVSHRATLNRMSFETYKVQGDTYNGRPSYVEGVANQNGIVVSPVEFPGSKQTPAGVWIRGDYFWQDPDLFHKTVYKSVDPVDQPVIADLGDVLKPQDGYISQYPSYADHLQIMYLGGHNQPAANIWNFIKNQKYKTGQVVMFIRNKSQMGAKTQQEMAEAGFRCVLVTGNRNHPSSSILYLYERKLTDEDFAQLHTTKRQKKEKPVGE